MEFAQVLSHRDIEENLNSLLRSGLIPDSNALYQIESAQKISWDFFLMLKELVRPYIDSIQGIPARGANCVLTVSRSPHSFDHSINCDSIWLILKGEIDITINENLPTKLTPQGRHTIFAKSGSKVKIQSPNKETIFATIGFFSGKSLSTILASLVQRLMSGNDPFIDVISFDQEQKVTRKKAVDDFRKRLGYLSFDDLLECEVTRLRSCMGFAALPRRISDGQPVQIKDKLIGKSEIYSLISKQGNLFMAGNGYTTTTQNNPAVHALISKVNSAVEFCLEELVQFYGYETQFKILLSRLVESRVVFRV